MGSNQLSKSSTAISAAGCKESGFVVLFVMAWSPVRRFNAGCAISPDAEIRPHRLPVDLQAGFCYPSLRNIVLAMGEEPAQARTPDGGAREEPASRESMQRLERQVLFSLHQRVKIFAADEMCLRHMLAQDPTFRRLNSEGLVPIWQ